MQMNDFNDIAIVGVSCRFPGSKDSNEFWENMINGIDSIGASLDWQNIDPSIITNHFASINDKDGFDNDFFNISPREAIHMDPQQRLLLEETWHCIEDSGIPLKNLQEKCTSVFVGALSIEPYSDYWSGDEVDNYTGSGAYPFMLANRISYFWGFSGISKVIDTACSSSFMALYDAYISLLNGSSDYAIVSGIHMHHGPMKYSLWSKNHMLTYGGKCRTFDKEASGIVAGEGVGVILLQPLQKAIAEKSHIYGVIKSCAINHGGKAVSVSSPRVVSQRNVIISAIEKAKISPETISYIETHGTGTSLGDPIEIEALKQAYQKYTKRKNFCKIGSVKTNIGHLMSAAGMTSLIKVLLMLKYKKIPAILNYTEINPIIDVEDSPFVIATKCEDWKSTTPLRAGISCFGYGGVNGHVILEEYCDLVCDEIDSKTEMFFPLLFSAQSLYSLKHLIEEWRRRINSKDILSKLLLRDVCLSQLFSRTSFNVRCGGWVSSEKELLDYVNLEKEYINNRKKILRPLLLCTGNISIKGYSEMKPFFESSFFFRRILTREFDKLKDRLQWDFEIEFLKDEWDENYMALFRFFSSYVLTIILIELGVKIDVFTACGNGIWAALVICGMLKIDDIFDYLLGKKILSDFNISRTKYTFYDPINRNEYKKFVIDNEYISVLLSKSQISSLDFVPFLEKFRLLTKNQFTYRKFLEEWKDYLPISKIEERLNDNAFVDNNKADYDFMLFVLVLVCSLYKLNQKWGFSNKLNLKNKYFDELVSLVADEVVAKDSIITLFQRHGNDIEINYNNLHDVGKYEYLKEYNETHFKIEDVSAWIDNVLSLDKEWGETEKGELVLLTGEGLFSTKEQGSIYLIDYSIMSLRNTLMSLWTMGYEIKWEKWFDGSYNKVSLPLYPFNHKSFLLPRYKLGGRMHAPYIHPLLQQNISSFSGIKFKSLFYGNEFFLKEHIIDGKIILPAAAYIEIVYKLADLVWERQNDFILELKRFFLPSPFVISNDSSKEILVDVVNNESLVDFRIYSVINGKVNIHGQGSFGVFNETEIKSYDLQLLLEECKVNHISHEECYECYRNKGINYGDSFRCIHSIHVGAGKAIAEIRLPHSQDALKGVFSLNPALLDAALQTSIALIGDDQYAFLPFAIKRCLIFRSLPSVIWSYVKLIPSVNSDVVVFEVKVLDEKGRLCVLLDEVSLKKKSANIKKNFLALQPCWKTVEFDNKSNISNKCCIILCGFDDNQNISSGINTDKYIIFNSSCNNLEEYMLDVSLFFLNYCQRNICDNNCKKIKYQIIFNREKEYLVSLYGFFKSLSLEYLHFEFQLIGVAADSFVKRKVLSFPFVNHSVLMENSEGRISYRTWEKTQIDFSLASPWKDDGVYIITGGLGGVGVILAQDILQKAKRVKVVLLGRSPLSENSEKKISRLVLYGGTVEYHSVDITSFEKLNVCLGDLKRKYSQVNGILHCAGVIRDRFFKYKKEIDFKEVLSPKIQGLLYLDRVTQFWNLDFFVCFSSIAATLGNVGQADYAMANAFMDSYMSFRNKLVYLGQRKGNSLSVNWPLWKDGGMQISSEYIQHFEERLGIYPMESKVGLSFLYMALQKNYNQLMVFQGDSNEMEKKIVSSNEVVNNMDKMEIIEVVDKKNILKDLIDIFSRLLRIDSNEIDEALTFDEYGCDSIVYTEFASELNQKYKLDLTPTIFFEYRTLESLYNYLKGFFTVENIVELQSEVGKVKPHLEIDESSKMNEIICDDFEIRSSLISGNNYNIDDDVAIIGMTGKFPMAEDLDVFWENLVGEKNCIAQTPLERLKLYEKYINCQTENLIKWGGFISDIDKFDPLFFGISFREAENMDPQQRILLMYAWKTIEDAGYSTSQIKGSNMGVIIAIVNSGYDIFRVCSKSSIDGYSYADIVPSMSANRISYFLDIHGPSETVETACSSSLVAIHRAIKAIKNGECEMVLVGGINLLLNPELYISFDKAGMLAHDGKCKTFSKEADGYVRGEGVGMLLLKRKKKAIEDRDNIYGIIRASYENHGGKANTLTSPNLKAQTDLLVATYNNAQIDPGTISYIEAHGTGTKLGDPIEVDALKAAFKILVEKKSDEFCLNSSCALGSVKTNVGHLEIAAGMSGIIKVLLQMKHEMIVKSLHCNVKNPYIKLEDTPFYIADTTKEWNRLKDIKGQPIPLRAGISSFGFGGVNVHLVLEEYICNREPLPKVQPSFYIILLSAKTETALLNRAILLLEYAKKNVGKISLPDMAYTLQLGRDTMAFRLAILVDSEDDLINKLYSFINKKTGDVNRIFIGNNCSENSLVKVFSNDELSSIIKGWINDEKYEKLLKLWVEGVAIDWNLLYDDHPYRVSLPTYPFDLSSYWVNSMIEKSEDNCESIIDGMLMGDIDIDSASDLIACLNS